MISQIGFRKNEFMVRMVGRLFLRLAGRRLRRRSGFSLVEMLVVMTIVLSLTLLSVLAYQSYQNGRLAPESARRITSVLRSAREMAIANNGTYTAVLDMEAGRMWIDQSTTDSLDYRPQVASPIFLPDHVQVSGWSDGATTGTLLYYPYQGDGTGVNGLVRIDEPGADRPTWASVELFRTTGQFRVRSSAR